MPGILDVYVAHAGRLIEKHENEGTISQISRKNLELQILDQLEKAKFPIEIKLAYYHAILTSNMFEAFWRGVQLRHDLQALNMERYKIDVSQYDFAIPDDVEDVVSHLSFRASGKSRAKKNKSRPRTHPPVTPRTTHDEGYETKSSTTSSQRAYARELGGEEDDSDDAMEDVPQDLAVTENEVVPAGGIIDPNGLERQEGDDGAYDGHGDAHKKRTHPKTSRKTPGKGKNGYAGDVGKSFHS